MKTITRHTFDMPLTLAEHPKVNAGFLRVEYLLYNAKDIEVPNGDNFDIDIVKYYHNESMNGVVIDWCLLESNLFWQPLATITDAVINNIKSVISNAKPIADIKAIQPLSIDHICQLLKLNS